MIASSTMLGSWWTAAKACGIHLALFQTCILGDGFLFSGNYFFKSNQHRAVLDNAVHGIVGFLSWCVVTDGAELKESLICGVLASLIDVDHFIAARSLNLNDALNLQSRPPFHNTLLLCVPFLTFLSTNIFLKNAKLHRYSLLYITAVVSHHVRDGYRRGITLNPLPNIPQFHYWIYIILILLFPHLIKVFIKPHLFSSIEIERNPV